MMGGDAVPAIGFAMGVERIIELLKLNDDLKIQKNISIPIINTSLEKETYVHLISKNLRTTFEKINFFNTDSSASLTSQLKHAMKVNDTFVIKVRVIGKILRAKCPHGEGPGHQARYPHLRRIEYDQAGTQ